MKTLFKHLFLLFLFANVYLFAKVPKWYEDIQSVYPDLQYIAQIGYGKDKATASVDALDSISRFFSTTVSTNVDARTSMRSDNENTYITRGLDSQTVIKSQIELFAVEYSKPYYDKKLKQTAIVAYIDRDKAWNIYNEKIKSYADSFMQQYQLATSQHDKLKKYFLLHNIKTLAKDFLLAYDFAILLHSSKCKSIYATVNDKAISLDVLLKDLKMECTMIVMVKNDHFNIIQRKVSALLAKKGFPIQNQNASYQVLINCVCDILEEKDSYGKTFTSYPGIEIIIHNSGQAIFSYSKTCKKTVAFEKQKNITMSYQKLEKELDASFIKELSSF